MPKPPLPAHVVEMLARPNPAVIGTIGPDGSPVTVATWYLWDDGRILVNMDAGRRRLSYIQANPKVSLTALDADDWYSHVSLQGRMTLEDDPDLSGIDRLSRHYLGTPYQNRSRPRVNGWIEIDNWHVWGKLAQS